MDERPSPEKMATELNDLLDRAEAVWEEIKDEWVGVR